MKAILVAAWIILVLVILLRGEACIYKGNYLVIRDDSTHTMYRIHHFGKDFSKFLNYKFRAGRDDSGKVYFKAEPDLLEYLGIPEICDSPDSLSLEP